MNSVPFHRVPDRIALVNYMQHGDGAEAMRLSLHRLAIALATNGLSVIAVDCSRTESSFCRDQDGVLYISPLFGAPGTLSILEAREWGADKTAEILRVFKPSAILAAAEGMTVDTVRSIRAIGIPLAMTWGCSRSSVAVGSEVIELAMHAELVLMPAQYKEDLVKAGISEAKFYTLSSGEHADAVYDATVVQRALKNLSARAVKIAADVKMTTWAGSRPVVPIRKTAGIAKAQETSHSPTAPNRSTELTRQLRPVPEWTELTVSPSSTLEVNVAVQYSSSLQERKKRAVLLVQLLGRNGTDVGESATVPLAYSQQFGSYYKYLVCSNGASGRILSLPLPAAVERVRVGLATFNISGTGSVSVSQLSVVSKPAKKAACWTPPTAAGAQLSILGWPEAPDNGKPRVIGVMDEFTTGCFGKDVNLVQPRPDNWYALAEKNPPTMFFIESAWKGNGGSWQYRVGDYQNKPGFELEHLAEYAKEKGIPTIFWNKEDPVHHQKFMSAARIVDHIFTTDVGMVESYRKKTGNPHVYVLPFAAQPALHKPMPLQGRIPRACFAGSWYGNRHAERGESMRWLLQAANRYGLDIFDRNYGTGIFPFPDEFQHGIKGSLPYEALCREYSRYRVFLNVNSVTESPTMFSRRVFELMACGTPVVSTYSRGVSEMFETDAVWMVANQAEADEAIRVLMTDDAEWRRRSLLGIREVFSHHTYAHRLNTIFEKTGCRPRLEVEPPVLLTAKATTSTEVEALLTFAKEQSYRRFTLLIERSEKAAASAAAAVTNVEWVPVGHLDTPAFERHARVHSVVGWLSPTVSYGKHYLQDLVNAMCYQLEASGWGKALGEDAFAFGIISRLAGSIWRPDVFLKQWRSADSTQTISDASLFIVDSGEFDYCHGDLRKVA